MKKVIEGTFDAIYYNACENYQPLCIKIGEYGEDLCGIVKEALDLRFGEEEKSPIRSLSWHKKHNLHGKRIKITLEIDDSELGENNDS